MKVLIIGSGTMGVGIAQVIASNNHQVILHDIEENALKRGIETMNKNLTKLVSKDKISEEMKETILSQVHITTDLNDAKDVSLVIEAAVENMVIKKKIFAELDRIMHPEAILATNTSSLSITELAASTKRPERVIGLHFFNPAPVMKLVEVINGLTTSDETFKTVYAFIDEIKKTPVEVKEAPGFVVNRILVPMINEAIGVLADGVATKEAIDQAMMLGANHPIGPLALADLIGNDVVLAIMDVLYEEFKDPKYRAHPYLRKMVRGGLLGRKTGMGFYTY